MSLLVPIKSTVSYAAAIKLTTKPIMSSRHSNDLYHIIIDIINITSVVLQQSSAIISLMVSGIPLSSSYQCVFDFTFISGLGGSCVTTATTINSTKIDCDLPPLEDLPPALDRTQSKL